MDLDFSEEQEMLREMVRGVVGEYSPIDVVREMEDDATGYPAEFWKQLRELGLLGILLPEAYGGSNQSLLEAAIVYEEFGRGLAPSPHFVSAVLGARVLLEGADEAQRDRWLPKLGSGEAIFTPAWLEPGNGFGPRGVQAEARRDGDSWLLSGAKSHVPYASSATRLLALARTGEGETDVGLFLVDPTASSVTLIQRKSLASDTQYDVVLADAPGERVGDWSTWDSVMQDGVVLLAAYAMGACERALELTVEYAKERKQFDKPLAAFQAISHYLADASTAVDGGKILVYEAAWARAEGRSIAKLAPMAKLFACKTFRDVTAMAQQVFGGVGFTLEYDIQLYFRRAKQLQITWWDERTLEERIANEVFGASARP